MASVNQLPNKYKASTNKLQYVHIELIQITSGNQVVESQKHLTYTRQNATVMCPYIDIVTYYIFSHVGKGLKLNAGKDIVFTY